MDVVSIRSIRSPTPPTGPPPSGVVPACPRLGRLAECSLRRHSQRAGNSATGPAHVRPSRRTRRARTLHYRSCAGATPSRPREGQAGLAASNEFIKIVGEVHYPRVGLQVDVGQGATRPLRASLDVVDGGPRVFRDERGAEPSPGYAHNTAFSVGHTSDVKALLELSYGVAP